MRTLLSFLAVGFLALAPACGGDDSSSNKTDSSVEHDLAVTVVNDMTAAVGTEACSQLVGCANACSAQSCVDACVPMGTADAQQKFAALFACAKAQCAPTDASVPDGGTMGTCTGPNDTSSACASCVKSAATSSACSTQFSACFS